MCLPPFCWRLLSLAYVPTRPPEVTFGAVNALPALQVALTQVNFLELREGEVRLVPGRLGENFSGSCIVTSRNPLIQKGATTATKSGRFHPKGVLQGLLLRD